ncbi:hypothetical protein PG2006B_0190 [Bifidobacterium animalis subsp. animalis]|nr:hypothetical protein PG2006B_0190 [Bifidobacterium animalis subsp. animalis]
MVFLVIPISEQHTQNASSCHSCKFNLNTAHMQHTNVPPLQFQSQHSTHATHQRATLAVSIPTQHTCNTPTCHPCSFNPNTAHTQHTRVPPLQYQSQSSIRRTRHHATLTSSVSPQHTCSTPTCHLCNHSPTTPHAHAAKVPPLQSQSHHTTRTRRQGATLAIPISEQPITSRYTCRLCRHNLRLTI